MWMQNRAEFDNRRLATARKFGGLFTFESAELLNKAAQSHDTTFTQVESDWLIGSCHRSHGFPANIPVTFLILNMRVFFNYKLMTLSVFNEKTKLRGSHFAESEAADVFKVNQFARYPLQMPKASRALAQSEGHVS
ncbi:hypothetical protein AVEN_114989-1 [Araneus ventricosus]|uniref:Uncharacterized protein n=1 Tax=Araneus ventricosus TaxID=182803 RepID=A0A4Y2LHZ6_ARAVE|nr:hypothetical protein AVEN_25322-1 [Araneus ventricosus]GBN14049.1 hypothetical protein AVEN_114989-1 [Araneus ventricosus]